MIAYYNITASVTLYIKEIMHDCEDYVKFFISDNERGESSRVRKSQIRYTTKGSPYFICNRRHVYLDECIKIK